MSREIKFKYIWSNPTKTNFLTEIFTLDQIEHGEQFMVLDNQPFFRDYRVIARLQSTNLLDKNGKEIYEGDIVRLNSVNYEIIYRRYHACFMLQHKDYSGEVFCHFFHEKGVGNWKNTEIIGNIYKHKYLQEEEIDFCPEYIENVIKNLMDLQTIPAIDEALERLDKTEVSYSNSEKLKEENV